MTRAKKFGALSGVFVPSILTILGVIMYMRLPWIVGQAGFLATMGIILVAHIISLTTSLSVASIATDKKVEAGGSYYIISRTMGLPIGGTLGLALFTGLSFSISLYLIGFAEVTLSYFGFETTLNNIRLAGTLALIALTVITFISTSIAIKTQYFILAALILSLASVFMGPSEFAPSRPLLTSMQDSLPWITLFAIFFPAVTGFEAGVSMSGDLKDPRRNIPAGTILAVITGLIVYVALAGFFAFRVDRELLVYDPAVLFQISWIPQLVVAGIMGATLSSALGSILGAPRILQATAIDKITPHVLGKGFGVSNEPRNALIFTFIIALIGILIGELNVIARIVTIFFIITYGFLNITYAIESWAGTDFRPTFKIPGFISIIGALACIVVMIQLDVIALIAASLVLIGLFLFLKKKELTLQTGDTWNSVWTSMVKTGLEKLTRSKKDARNWRPNIILFSGGKKHRPYLIDIGRSLTGKLGIFTNFELVESKDEKTLFSKNQQVISEEIEGRKGVFTRRHICRDIYEGIESIAKVYGFSGFEPNTIMMGWSRNSKNPEKFSRLLKTLKKLDYNTIFLNYDKEKEFGEKRRIDFWWCGYGRNINFALALIRFLNSSEDWRKAELRILAINYKTEITERYHDLLQQVLDNNRIRATIKIINNNVEQLPESTIMQAESTQTDLSVIELPEKDEPVETIRSLIQVLPSCMIIQSSSFFEALTVVRSIPDDSLRETPVVDKPDFEITNRLNLAKKEIIANEIFQVALKHQDLASDYFNKGFGLIKEKTSHFQNELIPLIEKTCEHLQNATKAPQQQQSNKEFLRIINDYSYQCQRILQNLKQDVLAFEKQCLQSSTEKYFEKSELLLLELPQHIRIKYSWKDFRLSKNASFMAQIFQFINIIGAKITGRSAVYKINIERAARYYLYHRRLVLTRHLQHEFFIQSFHYIIEIRKLLSELYELIEKGKKGLSDVKKFRDIVLLEKNRFNAHVALLEDQNNNFFNELGIKISNNLVADFQQISDLFEKPSPNQKSKGFVAQCKKDDQILEYVTDFPTIWHNNISLFVNKTYLDFIIYSLKNRIETKIQKFGLDFLTGLNNQVLAPLQELHASLKNFEQTGVLEQKPERNKFQEINADIYYTQMFEEITGLFQDLPGSMNVSGDDLTRGLENQTFGEAQEITIAVRKTIEYSISSEFIDLVKKQLVEFSLSLSKSITRIHDIIRLVNFNFVDDTDDEASFPSENNALIHDFLTRLEVEEKTILQQTHEINNTVLTGLKNAFASLSSGSIVKTSGTIEKKIRANENRQLLSKFSQWNKNLQQNFQNQFVKLIYSRSEGILWVDRIDKTSIPGELSNEEIFSFLEKFSPDPTIMKQLPFYYSRLFSGKSGIGEDFWVGMEHEIKESEKAIRRYHNGQSGLLLITGERNSGKTSLSKYIARKNFSEQNIFNIRAPRECNADVDLFEKTLLKSMKSENHNLSMALHTRHQSCVFIINDLELWWERKEHGDVVIEKIMQLVQEFGRKALFIININVHSLLLLHKLTGIQSWAIATIRCSGFDARQLKELIILRHQAGGMQFMADKMHEYQMNSWDFARLFNRYFDLSKGNPGMTINLWLASIRKVSGRTLYLQKPKTADVSFLEKLSREQIYSLLQFIYHIRFSASKLASILQADEKSLQQQILNLWQSGILVEKFPGIYAINSALHLHIIDKLKEMKLL